MKKIYSLAILLIGSFSFGQISLTTLNSAYTQNFDDLASTGTGSLTLTGTLAGWSIFETGTNANTAYTANTGTSTAGDTYSYGATSATDRALGSIASGSLLSRYGAQFKNDTGNIIDQLEISYVGEEWRLGDIARGTKDQITFEYSTDATSLTTGTWTAVSGLLYETTNLTGTAAGNRNGNDSAYRTLLSNTISGLNIPSGQTFWIRFVDVNISSTDDGLAIDDFSLTPKNSTLSLSDISKSKNLFLKNTVVENVLSFQAKGAASVKIYNVNGQLIKSAIISSSNSDLNLSSLSKGNYIVTAESEGEKISQKIMKK